MEGKKDYIIMEEMFPATSIAHQNNLQNSPIPPIEDYSVILIDHELEFKKKGFYFQVGEIKWIQGWILDISSVIFQFSDLLRTILPVLKRENIPFQVIQNSKKAISILNGESGYLELGKLISIYPLDEHQALKIAQKLIQLTIQFKGPHILTDRQLGNIVYTRYGAGSAIVQINENGFQDKLIYNPQGKLIKDPYSIPFELLEDITWPFDSIIPVRAPKQETVLQDKYKPMAFLKTDAKGHVRKGLHLEKWWHVSWCVIKEGKQNMSSDIWGRDIADRLLWQFELHKDLEEVVPIPKVYDFFEENGNTYLVMEYIKGISLEKSVSLILNEKSWKELSFANRLELLDYAIQLLDIIGRIHEKGYIHRDITPGNFLVNKDKKLRLIDLELSFNARLHKPMPPFRLGTPGFMSPEQLETMHPEIEQDIYALGSLLIFILTGMMPDKFSLESIPELREQLAFFVFSFELIEIITDCFQIEPKNRPSSANLQKAIIEFREKQKIIQLTHEAFSSLTSSGKEKLEKVITNGLDGLASRVLLSKEGLWISRAEQEEEFAYYQAESVSVHVGFYQGVSGVLFLLARAHKIGFSIQSCHESYKRGIAYIQKTLSKQHAEFPGGLYTGTGGVAIALAEGIHAGLISSTDEILEEIQLSLQNKTVIGQGIVKGLAGQGMALLKVASLIPHELLQACLLQKVEELLQKQQKDGSWIITTDQNNISCKLTGFGHGIAGILCFLLEYCKGHTMDIHAWESACKGMEWLCRQVIVKKDITRWPLSDKTRLSSLDFQDGCTGVVLCLIKGFQILGNPKYRQQAEAFLRSYPGGYINTDITLANGLAGLGEVYLEAAQIFDNEEWKEKADWIVNFIIHHFRKEKNGSYYWMANENKLPTAGLLTGSGGVIHFLMRCSRPGQLTHPLLNQ